MTVAILACLFLLVIILGLAFSIREGILFLKQHSIDIPDSLLLGFLTYCVFLWAFFQIASLSGSLTRTTLVVALSALLFINLVAIAVFRHLSHKSLLPKIPQVRFQLSKKHTMVGLVFILWGIMLVAVGLAYPSKYADSMTYHLPRVYHWAEKQSIFPYTTPINRQIVMPPFAEYQILELFLLTGNDILAPLVQIFALLGCGLVNVMITRKLGGGKKIQIAAFLTTLSIPSVIVQATGTQNDIAVALFCSLFLYYCILWKDDVRNQWLAIPLGMSLGLAIFTKSTAYIFLFPICIWIGWQALRKYRKSILGGLVIILIAAMINAPLYLWNYRLFHNFFGETEGYIIQDFSPQFIVSNLIRDLNNQVHFNLSTEPACSAYDNFFQNLHTLTGIANDDPRNTYYFDGFFCPRRLDLFLEPSANNPIHYGLIIFTLLTIGWKKNEQQKKAIPIFFLVLLGYFIFLAVFRYQIANSRLLNTIFLLTVPFIFLLISWKWQWMPETVGISLFLLSFVWVCNTNDKEFSVVRMQQSMTNRTKSALSGYPDMYANVDMITDMILDQNCSIVGFEYGSDAWEYPFWLSLNEKGWKGKLEHMYVKNGTERFLPSDYVPCIIITNDLEKRANYHKSYTPVAGAPFSLLIKE